MTHIRRAFGGSDFFGSVKTYLHLWSDVHCLSADLFLLFFPLTAQEPLRLFPVNEVPFASTDAGLIQQSCDKSFLHASSFREVYYSITMPSQHYSMTLYLPLSPTPCLHRRRSGSCATVRQQQLGRCVYVSVYRAQRPALPPSYAHEPEENSWILK